ncbi:autotransporter outer membrane beta-barrel domain-containing protein [Variovorax sp. KBW07]|uniref:autotransporter outer membrane beta-barrel domain-containing protein n=1 Tax=Variovorax sp. KBW07 TaxID=2153358 RepID=UPI0021AA9758|nr:autotransporter outer membrane beta-barrel domain-containing protein [Variovorax sp. KBW07]
MQKNVKNYSPYVSKSSIERNLPCIGIFFHTVLGIFFICGASFSRTVLAQSAVPPGPIPEFLQYGRTASYTMVDGSKTPDLEAAAASWRGDAEFVKTNSLKILGSEYAYALGVTGKGVKVGDLDTGADAKHPEFDSSRLIGIRSIGFYDINIGPAGGPYNVRAGDPFDINAAWTDPTPPNGRNHGTGAAGTITARRDHIGTMGIAFDSVVYTARSGEVYQYGDKQGSLDSKVIEQKEKDPELFNQSMKGLLANGVRIILHEWQIAPQPADVKIKGGLANLTTQYLGGKDGKILNGMRDAASAGAVNVVAAGNYSNDMPHVGGVLPYFEPKYERNWLVVVARNDGTSDLASYSNVCAITKWYCLAAPDSTYAPTADGGYKTFNGTSGASAVGAASMALVASRYPYLDMPAVRDVLLSTASHAGTSPVGFADEKFGRGFIDLKKAMNGFGEFGGAVTANLPAGMSDTWTNNISETTQRQRKAEESAEITGWADKKADQSKQLKAVPDAATLSAALLAGMAQGKQLLNAAITANTGGGAAASKKLRVALAAIDADPVGKQLLALYEALHPNWTGQRSQSGDFDNFIAGRDDGAMVQAVFNSSRDLLLASNANVQVLIDAGEARIGNLRTKTDADYVGSLIKSGAGSLTLTGDNSYSGGTQLQGGTLGVGSSTALGTGTLAMSDSTTLQAAADGLSLANAVTLSGIGNIDTQAFGLTLSGAMTDGAKAGGLAKLGTGTLTLSGANTYSGPTGVINGILRAGSATGFSPRSAFFVDAQGQLDLANFDQSIGSLSGSGNVSLGTAALNTGADNSTTTFSGQIAGSGGLAKTGSGTFMLAGANVYGGATTVAAGTLQAGAANTFSAASAMTVNTGATLNLAGYSQRVAGMNLSGTVVVAGSAPGTVLTVAGPWVGNGGLLKLGAVSPAVSDHVLLSGSAAIATGITMVQVGNFTGLGGATIGNGIELIGTTGGASVQGNAFVLAGDHVDAGAYEYRLNNIGSGGYLSSSSPKGQTYYRSEVPQYAALPAQLRQASLAMLGNMHQRAGDDDVRAASGKPTDADSTSTTDIGSQRRAWGRVISTNLDIRQSGTVSPQSHGRLDGFQAGTDLLSVRNWRAGVYVGQLDGEMGVSGSVRGVQNLHVGGSSLHNQYLGAYGTYASDNGLYADAVLQSGRHSYSFVNPLTQSGSAGAGKGQSLLASVEVGQSFELGGTGNWKVEPQLQLTHQRLSLDDATLAGSTQVRQRPDSAWLARLGVRVKGEVGMGAGRLQPYARFNLYRASNGNDVASFSASGARTAINSSTGGTSTELAAGATLALTPVFGLYGELGKLWSAGGDTRVKSSVQASAGARVLW